MWFTDDPSRIDLDLDTRTISFENPSGARSAGGTAHRGRKGAPQRLLDPGERVKLADIEGSGTVRHLWMTFPPMPPEQMRAISLEVRYDDLDEPSIAAPCLDFFAQPHGRPVAFESALLAAQEGRGFNCWIPMPFRGRFRMELHNGSQRRIPFYYQIDYTQGPVADESGYLHAAFRRENPTQPKRDFVIASGLRGPGRFLGCAVGIRVLHDDCQWYGEGEVKMYLDDDGANPTWCGTGLEDYVGSAWGMGPHTTQLQGVPLHVSDPERGAVMPDWVSFYRWHLPDPVVFRERIDVTIQQIGALALPLGADAQRERIEREGRLAGGGWYYRQRGGLDAFGIVERADDYCATSYLYCRNPQPVARPDPAAVLRDIERRPYEAPGPLERGMAIVSGDTAESGR